MNFLSLGVGKDRNNGIGGAGRVGGRNIPPHEHLGNDGNLPEPRSRRFAIKVSEYETLNVEPYQKKKKKKKKGKGNSPSRSPKGHSPSMMSTSSKKSAVFDYGNIYTSPEENMDGNYFNSTNSVVNSTATLSSNSVNSSVHSSHSNTQQQITSPVAGGMSLSQNSRPLQKQEPRFISPIRTRDNANPLDIKTRPRKEKNVPTYDDR